MADDPEKDGKRKLTRKELSAIRKAEFARKHEEQKAEKARAKKAAKDDIRNSPMAKFLPPRPTPEGEGDPIDPASPVRAGSGAQAGAREGVLEGVVVTTPPIPEVPASPATIRYDHVQHEPTSETRAQVVALKFAGQSDDDIALYLQISDRLLRMHYLVELEEAVARAGGNIALQLVKTALAGEPKIIRWVAEKRLAGFGSRPGVVAGVQVSVNSGADDGSPRGGVRQIVPPPPNERGNIEVRMILGIGDKDIA